MTAARKPKRRGARGEGSVYYSKSAKRWEAVITTVDPDTGKRKRVKQIGRDKDDAKVRLAKMIAERRSTGSVAAKNYTVAHAIADLFRYPPASWRSPATMAVNKQHAARLTAALGQVTLARLTVGQVERHLLAEVTRKRQPLSASTVRDELSVLRQSIRRAVRDELVTRNVANESKVPGGAARRESDSMTVEQVNQLLAADLPPLWRCWVTIAATLGLRPGELAALAWEDVDLAAGVLRVRHSLHETPHGLVPGELKTEQSRRTMGMPQAAVDALVTWAAEQAEQMRLAGPAWQNSAGLVFCDGFGRPLGRQKINYYFGKACKAAGVARPDGQPYQPRELRHTFVSVLSDNGVSIEQIADAVGHRNSHVTKVVYRHQIADKISAAAQVMDTVFGTPAESR